MRGGSVLKGGQRVRGGPDCCCFFGCCKGLLKGEDYVLCAFLQSVTSVTYRC